MMVQQFLNEQLRGGHFPLFYSQKLMGFLKTSIKLTIIDF